MVNATIEKARAYLEEKTGIRASEFTYSGVVKKGEFTRYKFYKGTDRSILYTVLSEEEMIDLEEGCPIGPTP